MPLPLLLVAVPLALAALAFALPGARRRPRRAPGRRRAARRRVAGALGAAARGPLLGGWVDADAAGLLVLTPSASLFLVCAFYAPGYLALRPERDNRVFVASFLVLLWPAMTLVALAQHLGLLWVAIETTTLATAPLIYFNHNAPLPRGHLEVPAHRLGGHRPGAAGHLLPGLSSAGAGRAARPCSSPTCWPRARACSPGPGCGRPSSSCWSATAPRWAWPRCTPGSRTPTARRRAWSGALLAGGVTSCAFLALLRVYQRRAGGRRGGLRPRAACSASGSSPWSVAAVFMVRQRDFKRMLAYSSVEHMGILALGIGIGGGARRSAPCSTWSNNGLDQGRALPGRRATSTAPSAAKSTDHVRGAIRASCRSPAALFLVGFLAITGSPPFAPFFSEFTILRGALRRRATRWPAAAFLVLLALIFVTMGDTVLHVVQGEPRAEAVPAEFREAAWTAVPPLVLMLVVLALGLWVPGPLAALFEAAAAAVRGSP